jgi:hypothetical protein
MDFLLDAQGEDVVAGHTTVRGSRELAALAPDLLEEIERVCPRLEAEFGGAQEFELTVQDGELFLLQTRTAKRTPWAALRIATDQVGEELITPETALERIDDLDLETISASESICEQESNRSPGRRRQAWAWRLAGSRWTATRQSTSQRPTRRPYWSAQIPRQRTLRASRSRPES